MRQHGRLRKGWGRNRTMRQPFNNLERIITQKPKGDRGFQKKKWSTITISTGRYGKYLQKRVKYLEELNYNGVHQNPIAMCLEINESKSYRENKTKLPFHMRQ